MSNILSIVENEQTSEFYPTPKSLVNKMLDGIDWEYVETILEPSAGKGDILREIAKKENKYRYGNSFDVDCIEIDPNLRQILKYNFSGERQRELIDIEDDLKLKSVWNIFKREYEKIPCKDPEKLKSIQEELKCFFKNGIHIVHDDFLTYNPYKRYHLIILNPPFSNGDKHLLKALKMQEKGGNIICLLNAETLKNPYTETRRELLKQLNGHNAQIEYIEDAFTTAERKTGVEIALIKVSIPEKEEESEIYNHFQKAEEVKDFEYEVNELEVTDYIKAAVNQFNVEVQAGLELIRQYQALKPFIMSSFDDTYKTPLIEIKTTPNEYLKSVRLKYWRALLSNPKFTGKLTSKLRSEYREKVGKLADYDFTEFNIYTLSTEINSQIKRGIEDEIIAMFDRLTEEHSYYPECQKNRHLYNGWKTNKAHKIDKKVILPCYGIFGSWDGKPRVYEAREVLEDIERVLNFLNGKMASDVDLWGNLECSFKRNETKNIELKYFKATFYKKGTVHLTFTCPELIERFNIYAAQNKNWLPPCYGKTAYSNMNAEEKAVIDSFQGEKAYNEVMQRSSYYLAPVTNNQMLMLEG